MNTKFYLGFLSLIAGLAGSQGAALPSRMCKVKMGAAIERSESIRPEFLQGLNRVSDLDEGYIHRESHATVIRVHNKELIPFVEKPTTRESLVELVKLLVKNGTLKIALRPNGSVLTAGIDLGHEGHYDAEWDRDKARALAGIRAQSEIGKAIPELKSELAGADDVKRLSLSILNNMSTPEQAGRFAQNILNPAMHINSDDSVLPRIRRDPITGGEMIDEHGRVEEWAHRQNDALGISALEIIETINDGYVSPSDIAPRHKLYFGLLYSYLSELQFWKMADAGAWEVGRKVRTSSVSQGTALFKIASQHLTANKYAGRHDLAATGFLAEMKNFMAEDEIPKWNGREKDEAALEQLRDRFVNSKAMGLFVDLREFFAKDENFHALGITDPKLINNVRATFTPEKLFKGFYEGKKVLENHLAHGLRNTPTLDAREWSGEAPDYGLKSGPIYSDAAMSHIFWTDVDMVAENDYLRVLDHMRALQRSSGIIRAEGDTYLHAVELLHNESDKTEVLKELGWDTLSPQQKTAALKAYDEKDYATLESIFGKHGEAQWTIHDFIMAKAYLRLFIKTKRPLYRLGAQLYFYRGLGQITPADPASARDMDGEPIMPWKLPEAWTPVPVLGSRDDRSPVVFFASYNTPLTWTVSEASVFINEFLRFLSQLDTVSQ